MKNKLSFITLVLLSVIILGACSNDKEENTVKSPDKSGETSESAKDPNTKEDAEVEDQLDLGLGDTGVFKTVLGSYEMTVEEAEIIDGELEGETSTRDAFIILDLTIKNIGEEAIDLEDVILSMEVASNLEHSGSTDHAAGFDTINEFAGNLEPGEAESGQFLTIIDATEEYFFRKMVGNIASGSSNQVIWTLHSEDLK